MEECADKVLNVDYFKVFNKEAKIAREELVAKFFTKSDFQVKDAIAAVKAVIIEEARLQAAKDAIAAVQAVSKGSSGVEHYNWCRPVSSTAAKGLHPYDVSDHG